MSFDYKRSNTAYAKRMKDNASSLGKPKRKALHKYYCDVTRKQTREKRILTRAEKQQLYNKAKKRYGL